MAPRRYCSSPSATACSQHLGPIRSVAANSEMPKPGFPGQYKSSLRSGSSSFLRIHVVPPFSRSLPWLNLCIDLGLCRACWTPGPDHDRAPGWGVAIGTANRQFGFAKTAASDRPSCTRAARRGSPLWPPFAPPAHMLHIRPRAPAASVYPTCWRCWIFLRQASLRWRSAPRQRPRCGTR